MCVLVGWSRRLWEAAPPLPWAPNVRAPAAGGGWRLVIATRKPCPALRSARAREHWPLSPQGGKGRIGVVIASYMHFTNVSAR